MKEVQNLSGVFGEFLKIAFKEGLFMTDIDMLEVTPPHHLSSFVVM